MWRQREVALRYNNRIDPCKVEAGEWSLAPVLEAMS